MAIKIENQSTRKLPKGISGRIEKMMDSLPREHLRGIERLRLVDKISDPRLKALQQRTDLPGLYHPRQGAQSAWLEVAGGRVVAAFEALYKRILPRLSFKGI